MENFDAKTMIKTKIFAILAIFVPQTVNYRNLPQKHRYWLGNLNVRFWHAGHLQPFFSEPETAEKIIWLQNHISSPYFFPRPIVLKFFSFLL